MPALSKLSRPLVLPLLGIACMMTLSRGEPKSVGLTEKKIVFVAGKPSYGPGQHEHRAGCMLLADQLNKSGLPIEAVVTANGLPQDKSVFNGASAVVIYSDGGPVHPAINQLADMKKIADSGVGIGCIHYAVEIPKGEPATRFSISSAAISKPTGR